MKSVVRLSARALLLGGAMSLVACSAPTPSTSKPLVTDLDHTVVKRQSIGNCWLYAQTTWLESLLKTETSQDVDVSESYWTWWHWYDQLVNSSITELATGGFWSTSANIAMQHGWVLESEFIPSETGVEMSTHQSAALNYINAQLQAGGTLGSPQLRTAQRVRQELDLAFGASMATAEAMARSANSTVVGHDNLGDISLAQALGGTSSRRWSTVSFPRIYGEGAQPSALNVESRKQILRRVMRALNDYKPVVMSLMIDFNAMDIDDNGTFKKETLDAAGGPGHQGGHMLVLEDYTVDNVPGYGDLGEGDLSAETKAAALDGDLNYLVAKNSWGKNRPERGLSDGYTRFTKDYLQGQLAWKWSEDSTADQVSFYTTLNNFVLPPGY